MIIIQSAHEFLFYFCLVFFVCCPSWAANCGPIKTNCLNREWQEKREIKNEEEEEEEQEACRSIPLLNRVCSIRTINNKIEYNYMYDFIAIVCLIY